MCLIQWSIPKKYVCQSIITDYDAKHELTHSDIVVQIQRIINDSWNYEFNQSLQNESISKKFFDLLEIWFDDGLD